MLTWSITEVRYVGGDIPKLVAAENILGRRCSVWLHLHLQMASVPLGGGEVDDKGFLAAGVVKDVANLQVYEVVVADACVVQRLEGFHNLDTV